MLGKQVGWELNWAQIGWWEYPHGVRYTFRQYTLLPGNVLTGFYSPYPVDSLHVYSVLYNNTPGKFTFFVDAVQKGTAVDAAFVPDQAVQAGETKTRSDQMPGAVKRVQYFTQSRVWRDGSWRTFDLSMRFNSNEAYYGDYNDGVDDMVIWDKACTT